MLAIKKCLYYFSLSFLLILGGCKKEPINGSFDYKTLGTSANQLLSTSSYSSLQIEISYMSGYAPDIAVTDNLVNFLSGIINKPLGITVKLNPIAASGKTSLSLSEIVQIEKRNRTVFTDDGRIAVHILITDGDFATADIFGKSYWNTSICLLGKSINDASGGPGQPTRTKLYTTILEHEFGHLLGLVNQGSPMQVNHQDASHGAHCINPACLMYFSIETSGNGNANIVPLLDANCLADLRANGGK